ncbi:COR domain-containing protein [Haliscomenobacter hydrossis]|uniref:Leucine-rich repeat-containing protein n=1 Tax=Haliscomenobacter hydrossis (strain ATCC 27775 / DSM 1100 / LMG 10767 / O) TaxID=760192 RepID=F4KSK7_HALH1|nr:COR domain-containing protein [Haliscomenobacter hydrossis]AEE54358.1 leucine-rich repeat-containing protein [Haliscomenobacter hydrossis DSM 1100]
MNEGVLQLIHKTKITRSASLNLYGYDLVKLPEELLELDWLEKLNLEYNRNLSDIGLLSSFVNLKKLYLSNTKVSDLSPLSTLVQLNTLYISNTKVINLNPLSPLVKLYRLEFSNNHISDLSTLIFLVNLHRLEFFNTQVSDLSPLASLLNLNTLYMSDTKVYDLSPLASLINLNVLEINNTQISDLSALDSMFHLNTLNISNTKVSDLSPLKKIIQKGIPIHLKDHGKVISIENCPLKNPPLEIVKQGNEAILRYWDQIEEQKGTVELYEAKLIIVGEGGTGKTTLFEKLQNPNHEVINTPETYGINIYEGLPFTHPIINNNIFYANLWDFGGQMLQYMTHQFFLTPRALYVLMMDARRESPNLPYWFKIISLLGRDNVDSNEKVKLLLVFNKRGNTTGMPQYQDQLKYYEDSLDVEFMEVDFAINDHRFEHLQKTIQKALVTLPIVKSQLPRLWTTIREDLRAEAQTKNYIHADRLSEICSKYGINDEADQWLLSGYLHQLGTLLHFQSDKGLRSQVILNPQWAVDGVYSFLTEESIVSNGGRFSDEDFIDLLAPKGYSRSSADLVLQLMTKNNFDICYQASPGTYIAAQLLPDNAPSYDWYPKEVLKFWFQYPIMPKGLMSRLIVRLSEYIEEKLDADGNMVEQVVWKKGVVLHLNLQEGECRVRLVEDDAESKEGLRKIHIEVMGIPSARKYALRKVRDEVEDLHKRWFRSIKADEIVPCCCSECAVSEHPQTYKLENLLKRQAKRKDTSCDFSGEDVMILALLEGVYDRTEIREMTQQQDHR